MSFSIQISKLINRLQNCRHEGGVRITGSSPDRGLDSIGFKPTRIKTLSLLLLLVVLADYDCPRANAADARTRTVGTGSLCTDVHSDSLSGGSAGIALDGLQRKSSSAVLISDTSFFPASGETLSGTGSELAHDQDNSETLKKPAVETSAPPTVPSDDQGLPPPSAPDNTVAPNIAPPGDQELNTPYTVPGYGSPPNTNTLQGWAGYNSRRSQSMGAPAGINYPPQQPGYFQPPPGYYMPPQNGFNPQQYSVPPAQNTPPQFSGQPGQPESDSQPTKNNSGGSLFGQVFKSLMPASVRYKDIPIERPTWIPGNAYTNSEMVAPYHNMDIFWWDKRSMPQKPQWVRLARSVNRYWRGYVPEPCFVLVEPFPQAPGNFTFHGRSPSAPHGWLQALTETDSSGYPLYRYWFDQR